VDTNQDRSFTDETMLGEYNERTVFGIFGTDKPDTPVRESIGFGVEIDEGKKKVSLNLGVASHASLVVGAAVGSRGEAGRFDGMAPGAQLASVSEGGSSYGQTEATILAARHDQVDVIYFEQSSNITHTYLLRDGRLVPSVIADRLVERYGPSIVSPTHNFPVLGAIDDIVMGRGVIGIGGHESKDNFFMNHGVRVEHDDNLLITGGYGPMGNGDLKPDIISPSNYVSTWLGFQEGRAIPGLFQLPPGYTIAGGTSTATPTSAGGVALLISAARQAGVPVDPHRLKYAITRSARWVPHIAAYKQGNGVFNVGAAWEILQELGAGGLTVDIESRASVKTPYSHMLPDPNVGVGLFERSGWDVGDREERAVTLTRTSGPSGSMTSAHRHVATQYARGVPRYGGAEGARRTHGPPDAEPRRRDGLRVPHAGHHRGGGEAHGPERLFGEEGNRGYTARDAELLLRRAGGGRGIEARPRMEGAGGSDGGRPSGHPLPPGRNGPRRVGDHAGRDRSHARHVGGSPG
jgi:hypothetical protein